MRECGFKPSTATLELLTDACATANAEDAPDVYSALRAHDVPEFVAYTASMKVHVHAPPLSLVIGAVDAPVCCVLFIAARSPIGN